MDLFIVITLAILAVMGIVVGVSNDAVNFLNSAFGSKAAKKSVILAIAGIGVMVGVMTSSGMMDVARSGVFYPEMFSYQEIMILFLGMMLSNIILLDIYNTLGLPTSTTVSLVFGLLGSAMALALYNIWSGTTDASLGDYINSGNALGIVSGILLSVVLAFFTGHLLMYISRFIFSFRYHKIFNRWGALWCGVTLAGIIYFTVFKGLKSTSLIPDTLKEFVNDNTALSLLILWACSSVLLWILQRCKVNILRVSILAGTFSLALAFAGNDLVNFIGVPYAGYDSYMIAKSLGAEPESMSALANPTQANFWIMCAAGLVMVVTLFTSKKAMRVIETERKLSSQTEEATPNADAMPASRGIVRGARMLNDGLARITPNKLIDVINNRFEPLPEEERGDVNYDLIRATVNLTAAAILISIGTQLKLPLSTTYVVFMVSMGSSLADRAWGRESAVYRITGVMTVIMGWFVTGIGAFLIAIGVGLLLIWGGTIAFVVVTVACAYMLIKSNFKSKKDAMPKDAVEEDSIEGIIAQVCKMMKISTQIYDRTLVAVFKEDRKALKELVREANESYEASRQLKYTLMPTLRKLKDSGLELSLYYVQVVDYLSEIAKALVHITRPAYDHIDNNHKGLSSEQTDELMHINDAVAEIYGSVNRMLTQNDFSEIDAVLTMRDELFEHIANTIKSELQRINEGVGNTKASMFYLTVMSETKTLVLQARNLLKSQRYFLEHAGVAKTWYKAK